MSLHNASKEGNIGVVQQWLDRGADVNQADKNGWTPLSTAKYKGHAAVVALLEEHRN